MVRSSNGGEGTTDGGGGYGRGVAVKVEGSGKLGRGIGS